MLFNSLAFAIFLPVVFFLYWAIPHRARWSVLVLSGYYFYMTWNVKYVVLIFFTTLVSYLAAIFLEKAEEGYVFKSGGGITLLSDPKKEYDEMCAKVYIPSL